MKAKKKKPTSPDTETETPVQAATLLWNRTGWCVRYPDKQGKPRRIKLASIERADAVEEAEKKLPANSVWIIA